MALLNAIPARISHVQTEQITIRHLTGADLDNALPQARETSRDFNQNLEDPEDRAAALTALQQEGHDRGQDQLPLGHYLKERDPRNASL
jgi:hypothetical protein